MRIKAKQLFLKIYFMFYASWLFHRILIPVLFSLVEFFLYKFSLGQLAEAQLSNSLEERMALQKLGNSFS